MHLICGSTGAGKTTYAIALASRVKGIRFSIDDWMATLFVPERPNPPSLAWAAERVGRCVDQMWRTADQIVARDVDVVFDLGLSRRDDRDRLRMLTAQTKARCKLHYLDVSRETRLARVLGRSAGPTRDSFGITPALFEAMDRCFEAPTDDELYDAMIVCEG